MNKIKRASVIVMCVIMILGVFTACGGKSPDELIIGSWRDSTGTTGYEFREDGSCEIVYADVYVPFFGTKVTGKAVGTYSITKLEDDTYNVKLVYTILTKTLQKEYKFKVENNALYLTDITDGTTTVYMAQTSDVSSSAPVESSTTV